VAKVNVLDGCFIELSKVFAEWQQEGREKHSPSPLVLRSALWDNLSSILTPAGIYSGLLDFPQRARAGTGSCYGATASVLRHR
jgi:hypothetical protein